MSLQFDKLCRLCRFESENLISINEKQLPGEENAEQLDGIQIIEMLLEIQIIVSDVDKDTDQLPKSVCSPCVCALNQAYSFKKKCEDSENFFISYLEQNSLNTKNEITERLEEVEDESQTILQCSDCDFFCYDENTRIHHLKTAHVETYIKAEVPDPIEEPPTEKKMIVLACRKCGANFALRKSLNRHEKSCHCPCAIFKCEICEWRYTRKGDLENHKQKNHSSGSLEEESDKIMVTNHVTWIKEEPIPEEPQKEPPKEKKAFAGACKQCGATFALGKTLNRHEKDCKCTKATFKCVLCKWVYTRKADLDKHKGRNHPCEYPQEYQRLTAEMDEEIIIDDAIINTAPDQPVIKEEVIQEKLAIESPKPKKRFVFACRKCGANFSDRRGVNRHETHRKCTTANFKCEICDWKFTRKIDLDKHVFTHSRAYVEEQKRLKEEGVIKGLKNVCRFCSKSFKLRSSLIDHLRVHSGEKPYLCPICGKAFSQNSNLREHLMRHNNERPYECIEASCARRFVSKAERDQHFRTHTGEHPFVCDICGFGLTTSGSLRKHRRMHTGERPYACEYCPLKFGRLGTLQNHRRTHTGEKPFKCTYCEKAFAQKSDLNTHTRIHTGKRPYICAICGKTFLQSSTLKTHQKVHQKKIKPEAVEFQTFTLNK